MQRDIKPPSEAGAGRGPRANKSRSDNRPSTAGSRNQDEACQERVLDEWRRRASQLDVYLRNGTRIRGVLKGFDPFVMAIEAEEGLRLVYKQAVLTIAPAGARSHDETRHQRPVLTLKRRSPLA